MFERSFVVQIFAMSKKKLSSKQKPVKSSNVDQDDLKKQIDKNEAQQKVLEKMTQTLKEKNQ